ncbi:MAG: protein-glutamine gamma-glutamyltransferase [Verrucomicrobiota bacterium]|jgi:transglutaminase-like putative cysteine protease
MNTLRQRDTRIPRKPFLWLTAALVFTLPPMFGALASWVPGFFLATLAAKFWMEPKDYRLRSAPWKLILGAITLLAVFLTYGSVRGIEPGVSIVVVLMALKILEAHTAREFQVMVAVAWILCLCGFFLSQDLAIAFCLFVAFTLLLGALIQFQIGAAPSSLWTPLRIGCGLVLQATPLIVLLFIFFPRINTGGQFQFGQMRLAASGFSDQLSPGSVSALANSNDVAFRAEFPDGRAPKPGAMYWRGVVMSQGSGLEWRAAQAPASIPRSLRRSPAGESIRQWITIEPHGAHWIFALDWPADPPAGITIAPGNYLWSGQPIRKPRKYEVTSYSEIPQKELQPRERKILLEVPAWITPSVRDLAQSWATPRTNPRDVVNRGLNFFRTQGFRYSLSPGEYRKDDLEDFLFRRRVGFCEHYAASFATLMRLAGIPARVVVGYLGGEFNGLGRFFVIRQADAHAWCEVWLPQSGWTRIDPTSVVAPERVDLGLNTFLERSVEAGQFGNPQNRLVRNLARSQIFIKTRLAWQTLNYAWDTRVLSFDGETQESFLSAAGLTRTGPLGLVFMTATSGMAVIGIYAIWMQRRARAPRDRVKKLYERFCRAAARLGAVRNPSEGPIDFANRAAQLLPNRADQIRIIVNAYVALRYSAEPTGSLFGTLTKQVDAFRREHRPLGN